MRLKTSHVDQANKDHKDVKEWGEGEVCMWVQFAETQQIHSRFKLWKSLISHRQQRHVSAHVCWFIFVGKTSHEPLNELYGNSEKVILNVKCINCIFLNLSNSRWKWSQQLWAQDLCYFLLLPIWSQLCQLAKYFMNQNFQEIIIWCTTRHLLESIQLNMAATANGHHQTPHLVTLITYGDETRCGSGWELSPTHLRFDPNS